MSKVEEIKKAASALSAADREELVGWLLDQDDAWDRQMKNDGLPASLISWPTKPALPCAKNHCAIGQSQRVDLEDDS
ncbi:MAG: hypothetical protein M3R59_09465 [Verrucomicrobiota bacterium]|nr:hypothetical protein [Verrucomicrobiota bacterium]